LIDHLGLKVADLVRSREFYRRALEPLGYGVIMEFPDAAVGLGAQGKPDFWLGPGGTGATGHVAFVSPDRKTVDAFHAAAIAAGGKDNGGPGLRPQYHPTYYGAFVLDPDGNNVEAVCHRPE
jgi:catechol 2,3-dioxygenase-like lactoylglutathione lyase family enzyme